MSDPSLPTVLVLHGDPATAERYVDWLAAGYDVEAATPDEAVELDAVDVVVLDWSVPQSIRRTVLDEVDAAVLAVTEGVPATDPIDGGAAEYLVGPVGEGDLRAAVERTFLQRAYRRWLSEYVDATEDVDPDAVFPPDQPSDLVETQEAMDAALVELLEEVPYSTLFRTLLDEASDPEAGE